MKFTTDHLPFGSLRCNSRVQRSTIPARVNKLVREWSLDNVGALTVSIHDRAAWIIDGQHRWLAAMERGLGDTKAFCHVYRGLSEKQEAELFLALNDSRTVSSLDKYLVGIVAEDEMCLGIRDSLAKYGLRIGPSNGDVRCIAEAIALYEKSPELLDDVFATLIAAWGTRATAVERVIVAGVGIVMGRYNGELDRSVLVAKLAKYRGGSAALVGDARGLTDYRPISVRRAAAEIIVDAYNKGRRSGQLAPL